MVQGPFTIGGIMLAACHETIWFMAGSRRRNTNPAITGSTITYKNSSQMWYGLANISGRPLPETYYIVTFKDAIFNDPRIILTSTTAMYLACVKPLFCIYVPGIRTKTESSIRLVILGSLEGIKLKL